MSCTVSLCFDKCRSEVTAWQISQWCLRRKGERCWGCAVAAQGEVLGLCDGTETALQGGRKSEWTCEQHEPRAETDIIWNCLPTNALETTLMITKWVLVFFQIDTPNILTGVWKWGVADPNMLDKIAWDWKLTPTKKKMENSKSSEQIWFLFLCLPVFDAGVEIKIQIIFPDLGVILSTFPSP